MLRGRLFPPFATATTVWEQSSVNEKKREAKRENGRIENAKNRHRMNEENEHETRATSNEQWAMGNVDALCSLDSCGQPL